MSLQLRQALHVSALVISPDVFIELSCSGLFGFKLSLRKMPYFPLIRRECGLDEYTMLSVSVSVCNILSAV
jgi:hypothetical protein